MVAISAQASPYSTGIESTGMAFFNKGLEDRIIKERNDSQSVAIKAQLAEQQQAQAEEEKLVELEKLVQVQSVIIQIYGRQGLYQYDDAAVKAARSQYTSYIPYLLGQKNKPQYGFIIPFELELTLEGISGFKIMESFRINKQVLPYTYRAVDANDIAFLVTGLEHQVNGQAWTTVVRSQIYITGGKYKTRRHILRDIQSRPQATNDANALQGRYSTTTDNNPYNLRPLGTAVNFKGVTGKKQGYRGSSPIGNFLVFDNLQNGVRAGMLNLFNSYFRANINTVEGIINKYAPASDNNNTPEYISNVVTQMKARLTGTKYANLTSKTKLSFKGSTETDPNNIKMFKELNKAILVQEGGAFATTQVDAFPITNLAQS
jgi:hypothetical protein